MEVRAFPNSNDHKRIHQDRALQQWGVHNLPAGYRPVGGGVTCREWYFVLYIGRPDGATEYLIKPHSDGKCEVKLLTPELIEEFLFVGDRRSGKSSDGPGSWKRFEQATVDGDDESSPVGTPSLGGYGERSKSTVVDDGGNAAAVGRSTGAVPPTPMPQRQVPGAQTQTLVQEPLDDSAFDGAYGGTDHAAGPNQAWDKNPTKKSDQKPGDRTGTDTSWHAANATWDGKKARPWDTNRWASDDAKKGGKDRGQPRDDQWSGGKNSYWTSWSWYEQ